MSMHTYIGIDWGGTFLKSGIIDEQGRLLKKQSVPCRDLSKKKDFFSHIGELLSQYRGFSPRAVGLGAPGILNIKEGSIYYLPNVPGWKNYPIKEEMEKRFKLPVAVDNDANLFALSEARLGSAVSAGNALFLTLGTGLGGAVMIGGKIVKGQTSAGEIGHVPVALNGPVCSCGGKGCVETYVGNRHLLRKYNNIQKDKDRKVKDVKTIYERALKKEPEAIKIWQEFSLALGMFLSGMINVFNPELIVFGGGVSGAFRVFKPMLTEVIKAQAMAPQARGVKLVKAKVKDAAIIGAGLLAKESFQQRRHV